MGEGGWVLVVSTLVHTGTPNRPMLIVRQATCAQNVAVIPAKVHILYVSIKEQKYMGIHCKIYYIIHFHGRLVVIYNIL